MVHGRPSGTGRRQQPKGAVQQRKKNLLFEFHQGAALRRELKNVTVEILGVADTDAVITQVPI
jgi:hypothetical protein